jgi:hypothetical protein
VTKYWHSVFTAAHLDRMQEIMLDRMQEIMKDVCADFWRS